MWYRLTGIGQILWIFDPMTAHRAVSSRLDSPVSGGQPGLSGGGSPIPLLSFFSGAGFLDIGFLRAGFEIAWHNECHAPFARAYEAGVSALGYNSGSQKIQSLAPIEKVFCPDILNEAFDDDAPNMFGIVGGPPCPDFSTGGKNNGSRGENGRLTKIFVNRILALQPAFFLLENVPGLLETGKHRVFLFRMLRRLSGVYALDIKVLNALDYGVPQDRRRVFVVGFKRSWLKKAHRAESGAYSGKSARIVSLDISPKRPFRDMMSELDELHWFAWPRPAYRDAKSKFKWPSSHGENGWKRPGAVPVRLTAGYHFDRINGHANAGDMFYPYSRKFRSIKEGDVSRKSFKRLHRDRYSPNAAYGNNEVHLHPSEPRRISVAEALCLQSVPPKYEFPEDIALTDKYKAVGNGVPVKLAERIACAIRQFVDVEEK